MSTLNIEQLFFKIIIRQLATNQKQYFYQSH
jgi:hypothetical protein